MSVLKGLGLFVPKRFARPKYECKVCPPGEGQFYEGEERAYQEHVARCAADHHDELVEELHRKRPPGFFKPFDPEYAAWVKKTGRVR